MTKTTKNESLDPKIEWTKQLYSALNQNNVLEMIEFFDPQIVRVEFEGTPSEGTFRGLAELKDHITKGRESWAEGSCEPEEFIISGDKVVALVHVRVKLKSNSQWVEGRPADVFTFKNGKVIEWRTFFDKRPALEWAGVTL